MNRGKLIVVLMLSVALVAAGLAIAHQYRSTRRPLEFWGAENARLIDTASTVELGRLNYQADTAAERIHLSGMQDVTNERGLIHFRRSLLEDSSFLWNESSAEIGEGDIYWHYAVRFTQDDQQVIVLLDSNNGLASIRGEPRVIRLAPHVYGGFRKYIDELTFKRGF